MSSFADSPNATCTFATASVTVSPASAFIISATIVVKGVTEVAPAGAFRVAVNAFPVSMLIPPVATIANGDPVLSNVNEPVPSVVVFCSPTSQEPLLFKSANTVAPEMYPSMTLPACPPPPPPLSPEPPPLSPEPPPLSPEPPPPQAANGSIRRAYLAPLRLAFFAAHSARNF